MLLCVSLTWEGQGLRHGFPPPLNPAVEITTCFLCPDTGSTKILRPDALGHSSYKRHKPILPYKHTDALASELLEMITSSFSGSRGGPIAKGYTVAAKTLMFSSNPAKRMTRQHIIPLPFVRLGCHQ